MYAYLNSTNVCTWNYQDADFWCVSQWKEGWYYPIIPLSHYSIPERTWENEQNCFHGKTCTFNFKVLPRSQVSLSTVPISLDFDQNGLGIFWKLRLASKSITSFHQYKLDSKDRWLPYYAMNAHSLCFMIWCACVFWDKHVLHHNETNILVSLYTAYFKVFKTQMNRENKQIKTFTKLYNIEIFYRFLWLFLWVFTFNCPA